MTLKDQLTSTELRAMQELEALLRKRREEKLRESLGADQDDIIFALESDGLSFCDPSKAGSLP